MTFVKSMAAAGLWRHPSVQPHPADPVETAKAAGKGASWLFIQTAQRVQFDAKTPDPERRQPIRGDAHRRPKRVAEAGGEILLAMPQK
jgi:hypothetical protein